VTDRKKKDSLIPVDRYVISQFNAINTSLNSIQNTMYETQRTVGEIEGVQKAQAVSLQKVEKRLDSVIKTTDMKVDDLSRETTEIKIRLLSDEPSREKIKWLRDAFNGHNVKILLLILAAVIAGALGVSFPFFNE